MYLNSSPLAKIEGSSVYYYHNDHLATPQKMTDGAGQVVWEGEFKPFGEAISITGTITNNLRFPGQYYDAETGLNYNYFRDYNPVIGRYIEKDPIGLRGGINLYAYAENDSINMDDPDGLKGSLSGCRVRKTNINKKKLLDDVGEALDPGDYNCNRIDFVWECVKRNCDPNCDPNSSANKGPWYVTPGSSNCKCLVKSVKTVFGHVVEETCLQSTCNQKCKPDCSNTSGPVIGPPGKSCPCVEWQLVPKQNWVD